MANRSSPNRTINYANIGVNIAIAGMPMQERKTDTSRYARGYAAPRGVLPREWKRR